MARPTTLHVSSECWRYEYVDPETGRKVRVHTCNWLHPGEDGWQTEWNANRNFKPAQPIQVLGAAPAAPAAAKPFNRFQSLLGGAAAPAAAAAPAEDGWCSAAKPKRAGHEKHRSGL